MTEQTRHLYTSGGLSRGSRDNLSASSRETDVGQRQPRAENCGQEVEVCPALTAGNKPPKPPTAAQPHQTPDVQAAHKGGHISQEENCEYKPPQETLSLYMDSDTDLEVRLCKKKHRRKKPRKRRKWKPYHKLSWEEKKAKDERETARAIRIREEMFAKGRPMAPYNTTQYLIDTNYHGEPDLSTGVRWPSGVGGCTEDHRGGDGIRRPRNASREFLQREYSRDLETYQVERLQSLTKQELVWEYLELQRCMSRMEEENNLLRCAMAPWCSSETFSLTETCCLMTLLQRLTTYSLSVDPSGSHVLWHYL
uniref:HEXIM P-TEFb complex subunit 1 n=1 Tax=Seriola dumerili TaxID=41447 RepID=A0A3B4TSX2_SERDU